MNKERLSIISQRSLTFHENFNINYMQYKINNLLFTFIDTTLSNHTSDEDTIVSGHQSPSREVSPKFIVGGKKYGRRSRPQSASFDSQSDSDNEYLAQTDQNNSKTMKAQKVSTYWVEIRYYVLFALVNNEISGSHNFHVMRTFFV